MTDPAPARLVVLISGSGSNLQALLDAAADPAYGAKVVAVGADRDGDRRPGPGRRPPECRPSWTRSKAYPTREDWDAALTAHVAEHQPDLVISAGFLKLVGGTFLDAFGDRYVNTHNALLPAFAGIHGPRDALAYGVKLAGATLFFVDAGVDTGPIIAQVSGARARRRHGGDAHRADQGWPSARQLVEHVGRLVREGWTITGRKVTHPVSPTRRRRVVRSGGRCSASTTRPAWSSWPQALHAAGVEIVSTGSTASTVEAAGVPVTRVEELTGFPEMPRRPGQDPAPEGARRPARRPAAGRGTSRSWPSWASSRSTCWCPTCTRSRRRWPPAPTWTSASSRSTSAARRWSGRRRRTTPSSQS